MLSLFLMMLSVALMGGVGIAGEPPAAGGVQPQNGEAAPPAAIETADDLLRALETAGADIEHLSADIRYDKTFDIQGDTQKREGKLVFESKPGETDQPSRRFGIRFDSLVVGTRVEDGSTGYSEQYIFDGEWLAEVYPREKQFIRRQVVAPGEQWDPLKIGEGPFPIPIQQKRDDIAREYDTEIVDPIEMLDNPGLQAVARKCYQLKLTPRVDAGETELREVRVWYERETLLPRMARTVSKADDVSLVLLKDVKLNSEAEVSEAELSTEPPEDLSGWEFSQEEYRGHE